MNYLVLSTVLASCALLVSCGRQSSAVEREIMSDGTKIVELSQSLRLLSMRWQTASSAIREFDDASQTANQLSSGVDALRKRRTELISSISSTEKDLAAAQKQSQQEARLSACGRTFPVFHDKQRSYSDVTITEVSDIGIHISHKDGRARIACDDLTESQVREFGLDSELARQTLQQEQHQVAAFHAAEDLAIVEQRKKEEATASASFDDKWSETAFQTKPALTSRTTAQLKTVYRVRRSGYYYTRPTFYYYSAPACLNTPMLNQQRTYPRVNTRINTPFPYCP